MRAKRTSRVQWVLLLVLMGLLVGLVMGAARPPDRSIAPGMRRLLDAPASEKGAVFRDLAFDYRMTDHTFVAREQAYFLLTPALLVQEAVSDDVVLTYPEE